MSFVFELSFNIKKNKNVTDFINNIEKLAWYYMCESFNINYEFMGKNRQIMRNHCILTILFPDDQCNNIYKFIKQIKKNKNIYIESFYYDNIKIELIFLSDKYLKTMNKKIAKDFIENRKNGLIPYIDTRMVKELYKRKTFF